MDGGSDVFGWIVGVQVIEVGGYFLRIVGEVFCCYLDGQFYYIFFVQISFGLGVGFVCQCFVVVQYGVVDLYVQFVMAVYVFSNVFCYFFYLLVGIEVLLFIYSMEGFFEFDFIWDYIGSVFGGGNLFEGEYCWGFWIGIVVYNLL